MRAALDRGMTTFDTADVYNDNRAEYALGRALAGIRREELEISTKAFWPTGLGPTTEGCPASISPVVDASLRRLGTDYVDIYHAHRFDARLR